MKAITLWQPWATLMCTPRYVTCAGDLCDATAGIPCLTERCACRCHQPEPMVKGIETRGWQAPSSLIGQRIAIHAAKRRPDVLLHEDLEVGDYDIRLCDDDTYVLVHSRDDSGQHGRRWPLALGAVIGTAVLAECLPMVDLAGSRDLLIDGQQPHLWVEGSRLQIFRPSPANVWTSVAAERPYGWFEPGRWAWIFTGAAAFTKPIPVAGRQGIWSWDPGTETSSAAAR